MNRLAAIFYLLISFSYTQIIPTDILNKVDIENIPNQIPSINLLILYIF